MQYVYAPVVSLMVSRRRRTSVKGRKNSLKSSGISLKTIFARADCLRSIYLISLFFHYEYIISRRRLILLCAFKHVKSGIQKCTGTRPLYFVKRPCNYERLAKTASPGNLGTQLNSFAYKYVCYVDETLRGRHNV